MAAQNPAQFNDIGVMVMWKILVAFAAFAALALFILTKSGGDIDLTGEKHDVTGGHEVAASAAAEAASALPVASAAAQ
jgi:hypothetical protein